VRLLRQLSFLGEQLLALLIFVCCARIIIATLLSAAFPGAVAWATLGFALIGFNFARYLGEIYAAIFPFVSGLTLTRIFPESNLPLLTLSAAIIGSSCRFAYRYVTPPARLRRWWYWSTKRPIDWPVAAAVLTGLAIAVSAALVPIEGQWAERSLKQARFGYGDPYYFISSASLWLVGLGYFNVCRRARRCGGDD
jgi:hypothetical protein